MDRENYFSGEERIENVASLGRAMRKGSPDALEVSDRRRIIDALDRGDGQGALAYLDLMHPVYKVMNTTFVEWCLSLPSCLARIDSASEPRVTPESFALFESSISDDPVKSGAPAATALCEALHPEHREGAGDRRRRRGREIPDAAGPVLAHGMQTFDALREKIGLRDWQGAKSLVDAYYQSLRVTHDLCGAYVSAYAAVMDQHIGQDKAACVTQQGLAGCDLLKNYWKRVVLTLDQTGLSAVLAEHLRGHFSGPDRGGAVRIVEDEEKIRLLMDPCGTGGALRRCRTRSVRNYPHATPDTWGRANEVPAYCAHCARNEQMMASVLGYPAWVTEFDPDPDKPCAWTFYKDPASIPEHYYTRIGRRKPARTRYALHRLVVGIARRLAYGGRSASR